MQNNKGRLPITILPGDYTILQMQPGSDIPDWVDKNMFWSVTDTGEEMTVISSGESVPDGYPHKCSMKIFKIDCKLDFHLTGILSSITAPLAEAGIPIFAISTFDTDYIFIEMEKAYEAAAVLSEYHDIDYYSW